MDSKVIETFCKNKFAETINKALSHLGKQVASDANYEGVGFSIYTAPYVVRVTLVNKEEATGSYGVQAISFSKVVEIEKLLKKAFEEYCPQHFFICESYSQKFNFQFSIDSYPTPPKSVAVQLIKDLAEEKK